MGKIFGIGLSKTGTTTLVSALKLLGYDAIHAKSEAEIHAHQAAVETTVAWRYKQLDKQYPGSKFILTVRNMDDWLSSCERFFRQGIRRYTTASSIAAAVEFSFIHGLFYGCDMFSRESYETGYNRHFLDVTSYFADRPNDLLIIDIGSGEGWDKLCDFLGAKNPEFPFPNKNAASQKLTFMYPLIKSKWNMEIVYSLRSLEKYYKGDFDVWTWGYKHPLLDFSKVTHIDWEDDLSKSTDYNLGRKLLAMAHLKDKFVWMCDDFYLLSDTTESNLEKLFYLGDLGTIKNRGKRAWQQRLWATYDRCKELGLSGYNAETHTPRIFRSKKLLPLFDKFQIEDGVHLPNTAYLNSCLNGDKPIPIKPIKVGLYSQEKFDDKDFTGKQFLSHNDKGLSDKLKSYIAQLYSDKSRFEK